MIKLDDLSKGEKSLFQLYLLLYSCAVSDCRPKYIFMDEPDAHMHGDMIAGFVRVLDNYIVGRFGIRVIMTTHRVETVACAPAGSLYRMKRAGPDRIEKVRSPNRAPQILSSNITAIVQGEIPVMVEADADVEFYSACQDAINSIDLGAKGSLLHFLPASINRNGKQEETGGQRKVREWVRRMHEIGICACAGIIDRDAENEEGDRVFVTNERYAIENYLCDPFIILAAFAERNNDFREEHQLPPPGRERDYETLETTLMQQAFEDLWIKYIGDSEPFNVPVVYSSECTLRVPNSLLDKKGKDLFRKFKFLFAQ